MQGRSAGSPGRSSRHGGDARRRMLRRAAEARNTNPGGGSTTPAAGQPVRGGTLNMLGAGDVDYMDPNISYYSVGYLGHRLWSRQLFTYPAKEGRPTTAVPDLATEVPTEDNGGIS